MVSLSIGTKVELGLFILWENIKIMRYYRPRVKYNFLEFHTLTSAKILHLGIYAGHTPFVSPLVGSTKLQRLTPSVYFHHIIPHHDI